MGITVWLSGRGIGNGSGSRWDGQFRWPWHAVDVALGLRDVKADRLSGRDTKDGAKTLPLNGHAPAGAFIAPWTNRQGARSNRSCEQCWDRAGREFT